MFFPQVMTNEEHHVPFSMRYTALLQISAMHTLTSAVMSGLSWVRFQVHRNSSQLLLDFSEDNDNKRTIYKRNVFIFS